MTELLIIFQAEMSYILYILGQKREQIATRRVHLEKALEISGRIFS